MSAELELAAQQAQAERLIGLNRAADLRDQLEESRQATEEWRQAWRETNERYEEACATREQLRQWWLDAMGWATSISKQYTDLLEALDGPRAWLDSDGKVVGRCHREGCRNCANLTPLYALPAPTPGGEKQ